MSASQRAALSYISTPDGATSCMRNFPLNRWSKLKQRRCRLCQQENRLLGFLVNGVDPKLARPRTLSGHGYLERKIYCFLIGPFLKIRTTLPL